jgi:hypothetical protein
MRSAPSAKGKLLSAGGVEAVSNGIVFFMAEEWAAL